MNLNRRQKQAARLRYFKELERAKVRRVIARLDGTPEPKRKLRGGKSAKRRRIRETVRHAIDRLQGSYLGHPRWRC